MSNEPKPADYQQPEDATASGGPIDKFAEPAWQAPPSGLEVASKDAGRQVRFGFQRAKYFVNGLLNWLAGKPDNTIARANFKTEDQAGRLGVIASFAAFALVFLIFLVAGLVGGEALTSTSWFLPMALLGWVIPVLFGRTGKWLFKGTKPGSQPAENAASAAGVIDDSFATDGTDTSKKKRGRTRSRVGQSPFAPLFRKVDDFLKAAMKRNKVLGVLIVIVATLLLVAFILFLIIGIPMLVFWLLSLVLPINFAGMGGIYMFVWTLTFTPVWSRSAELWRLERLRRARAGEGDD